MKQVDAGSTVPPGLHAIAFCFPSDESLGYFQMSLRDNPVIVLSLKKGNLGSLRGEGNSGDGPVGGLLLLRVHLPSNTPKPGCR